MTGLRHDRHATATRDIYCALHVHVSCEFSRLFVYFHINPPGEPLVAFFFNLHSDVGSFVFVFVFSLFQSNVYQGARDVDSMQLG